MEEHRSEDVTPLPEDLGRSEMREDLLQRRQKVLGRAYRLFYESPVVPVRALVTVILEWWRRSVGRLPS
jgi:hypothetical protein